MKALKIIEQKKINKEIKFTNIAKHLGITKQCFYQHLTNLRKGKITFSVEQIKLICDFLHEDTSIFFKK